MNLFLVRHAQSLSNIDPKELHLKTNMSIPLSDLGITQAVETGLFLGGYLQSHGLTHHASRVKVWNSPYNRTRQTAKAITEALTAQGIEHECEESIYLAERQFGLVDTTPDYETVFEHEARHYNMHRDQDHLFFVRPPLGESPFDMCMRLDFFIRQVLDCKSANNHIIVSHGAAIRGFIMMQQKEKFETYTSKNPPNASVRLIEGDDYKGEIFTPTEVSF